MQKRAWIGWLLLAPFAMIALLRIVAHDRALVLIWINSATPFVYLPAWILTMWGLLRRERALSIAASVVVGLHVAWMAPLAIRTEPEARGAPLRVVTANVLYRNATPEALVRELVSYDADVLALEEISPRWQRHLEAAPYPHRVLAPRDGPRGLALLSRVPLESTRTLSLEGVLAIEAELSSPRVRILVVHLNAPLDGRRADAWRAQYAALARRARGLTIVLGDLNATPHSAAIAALERAGLRSAHLALGRGLASTWPNGTSLAPPLLIDHVLISSHVRARRIREGRGMGSNHRPVIADLVLR